MRARGLLALFVLFTLAGLTLQAGPQQSQAPPTTAAGTICKWGGPGQIPDGVDEQDICCACTSVPVGKLASVDGSTMTSHSCDGHYEFQIHIVPGKKSAPGTMRPVMKGAASARTARRPSRSARFRRSSRPSPATTLRTRS